MLHRAVPLPRLRRAARAIGVSGAMALALANCTPGPPASLDDGSDASVRTDIANLGHVELTVWDQEVRGGQNTVMDELNERFEKKYPNVTIHRVKRSFEDLQSTTRLALSGKDAPDVLQVNNGRADMGAFVEGNLLRDLDPYAETYEWRDRFTGPVLDSASYSDSGAEFGTGSLYGAPQMGEMVGFYYNKDKLDDLGVTPPSSWEGLDAALAKAKDAGEIPVQFGNLDQIGGIHALGSLQTRYVTRDTIRDLAYGRPGATWTSKPNLATATQLQRWARKGYFTPDFNGVAPDPAWQDFTQGEGVFLLGGTWLLADMEKAMGDKLGFTAFPGAGGGRGSDGDGDGDTVVAPGGTSLPFAIPSRSTNADAAAAYIDFITDQRAMRLLADANLLPVTTTDAEGATSEPQREMFDTFGRLNSGGGMVPYLDYATVGSFDVIGEEFQNLTGGQSTPGEFTGKLDAEYSENTANVPQ